MSPIISIIIPAYNEATYLPRCLNNILNTQIHGWHKEIIIVNDGSSDSTKAVLAQIQKDNQEIMVVHNSVNRGKGSAIRLGINYAKGDILIVQDADLEYDPNDYEVILNEFKKKGVNVVYGSRLLGAKIYQNYNANTMFLLGGMFLTKLVNFAFHAKLTDQPTCYKAWRNTLTPTLLKSCQSNGFEFEVEMTATFLKTDTIKEVPIHYYPRSVSHGKKIGLKDFIKSVLAVFVCRWSKGKLSH